MSLIFHSCTVGHDIGALVDGHLCCVQSFAIIEREVALCINMILVVCRHVRKAGYGTACKVC